jgi:hypothetical protein
MDPKDIRGLSLGAVWNFFRRTGLSCLGPRKGAKRAGKAYMHWDHRGSTRTYSILFYSILFYKLSSGCTVKVTVSVDNIHNVKVKFGISICHRFGLMIDYSHRLNN